MSEVNDYFEKALRYLCDKKGRGIQVKLAHAVGVSSKHINDILKGRKQAGRNLQSKIVAFFDINYVDFLALGRWILAGKDPEEWERQRKLKIEGIPRLDLVPQQVPIITIEKIKEYAKVGFLFNPDQIKEWTVAIRPSQKAFAVHVMDDSMAPEFAKGDLVIVDPSKSPQPGNYVLALIQDTDLPTIKELQLNGDKVLLVPKNERYPIMDVTGRLDKCWPIKAKHREYIV